MIKYLLHTAIYTILTITLSGQITSVPMEPSYWEINPASMSYTDTLGRQALKISGDGLASIKNYSFQKGTISFEYYATGRGFCGIYFKRQAGQNRTAELESEFFYLRSFKIDDPMVPGSVQYAPIVKGTNLWDLLHDYEANGLIKSQTWNTVKLVISDQQMKAYLNGDLVLWIPELLGPVDGGKIALEGNGIYANMSIDEGNIEDLPDTKGADVTQHDVRYLRDWMYSDPIDMPRLESLKPEMFPDSSTTWTDITAGRAGLINLTSEISSPFIEGKRQMVWLKTTIESDRDQVKSLDIGFSDDVWVFINNALLHIDMNTYNNPISKEPNGRLHVDNTTIDLPLQKGSNEILISLANDFFGWGLVARLNNMTGVSNKMNHGK